MSIYAIPPMVGTIFFFGLAIFVLFNKPRNILKIVFAILCLETFFWQIVWLCSFLFPSGYFCDSLSRVAYLTIALIPATFYHFIIAYTQKAREIKYVYLFYIVAFTFVCLDISTKLFIAGDRRFEWGYFVLPGPLNPLFAAFALFAMTRGLIVLLSFIRSQQSPRVLNQAKYLLLATGLYFLCNLDFFQVYGAPWYPIGSLFFLLACLVISFAIFRLSLLDIQIVFQKTIVYTFWTVFVSVTYALILFVAQSFLFGSTQGNGLKILASNRFYVWSGLLAFVTNAVLAVLAISRDSKNPTNIKFALLSLCIGLWACGSWLANVIAQDAIALCALRINYGFGVFVPALFLDFVWAIVGLSRPKVFNFFYGTSTLFALFAQTNYFIVSLRHLTHYDFLLSNPGPVYYVFFAYFLILMITGLSILIISIKRSEGQKRNQLSYVLVAYTLGTIAGAEYFLSVFGVLNRPPADDYILAISFLVLSYAITRHSFLNIQTILRRTFFYSILAFLVSAFYIVIVYGAQLIFSRETVSLNYLFTGVSWILLVTFLLRPVEIFLRRILDRKFFHGTIEEISEQKEMLTTELERRERLKSVGILAAGMAHEIKNPLTSIQTFAEYLPVKYDDPEFRNKFSKIVTQEVGRIKDIIQDLLVFSKPKEPRPSVCDLEQPIQEIADFMSNDLLRAGIDITFSCEKAAAFIDKDQFKQVLLNILSNAIDALRGQPTRAIHIITKSEDAKAIIEIQDTGCGVPADRLPHIFDPFYSHKEGGTGLGLAITHSIVTKNNGEISVRSSPNQGTVFTLTFPSVNIDNI